MISVISSNPDKYCEFSKDVKLHNVGLREYEGEVINDTIRLKIKLDMVDSLLKDVYSDYFSEMNKKLDQQLKIFMKSKDMKNLEVYYGKEDVEWRMKKIIDEIVHNPQTYGKLDNGSYSLVDVKGKLIKEKEIKELWEKYFDENAAENFDILCKAVRAGLFVLIGSSIGCLIVIEMKK